MYLKATQIPIMLASKIRTIEMTRSSSPNKAPSIVMMTLRGNADQKGTHRILNRRNLLLIVGQEPLFTGVSTGHKRNDSRCARVILLFPLHSIRNHLNQFLIKHRRKNVIPSWFFHMMSEREGCTRKYSNLKLLDVTVQCTLE